MKTPRVVRPLRIPRPSDKLQRRNSLIHIRQRRKRHVRLTDAEKIRELAQRGKALTDLSNKNNFEHGIRNGGGGVILELGDFQYDKLIGKNYGRTS
jgi:hypothetical protein